MSERLDLLERVVENVAVGLLVLRMDDPDDPGTLTPVVVNAAACEASGQDLKADIGKPWRQTSPDLVDSEFARMFQDCVRSKEPASWEMEYGDSRFDTNWFRGTATVIADRTLLVMFENVTARKQLEIELARSNHELANFAYIASHDLRTPLRDVQNLVEWIVDDAADALPEESRRHLETLHQRVDGMERLLDDLLDYSRVGRIEQRGERFAVADLLTTVLGLVSAPSGFAVEVDCPDVEVVGPRVPLETVVRNLVANAIRHHDRDDGSIRIEVRGEDDAIEVAVVDDGPGIASEHHDRVFELFQRLYPKGSTSGTGIGLALVKKTVEAHGGQITLDSAPGEGARFGFTWPKRWPR